MPDTNPQETLDTSASEFRLNRLESAWRSESMPRWQEHLPADDEPCSPSLIFDLLHTEIEHRIKAGLPALLAERYFEHPRLQKEDARLSDEQQLELIRWEYQLRWQIGQQARRADYESAFPQHAEAVCEMKPQSRCPLCHKVFVLDETYQTRYCPTCESASPSIQAAPHPEFDPRGYQLIEQLGKGGMGEVYRSGDPALGRDLAIKVMKADYLGHAEAERRFLREARVTGSLQHPSIVPVHNLGRLADGRLHYTMRLVRGDTFADILEKEAGKPERLPDLLSIFEKICQAVAYAHSKRVIHRDLKPRNVMVGKFGEVQVMDWGLAKLLTPDSTPADPEEMTDMTGTRIFTESADTPVDLSRAGVRLGTFPYMPSEQARGKWNLVDERADVFALGSILCEILTGQPAYIGTSFHELCDRAERGDVAEALQRLQHCGADAALTALCRECLNPQRDERPRDADAVAKCVAEYQAEVQERLRQAEIERAEAQLKAREGHKQRRLLIALVLALLTGAALSTWQAIRASAERDDKEIALGKAKAAAEAAKESEQDTKAVLAFFQDKVLSAGRPTGHESALSTTVTLRQAIDKAAKDIADSFKDRPLVEASIRDTLGLTYSYLGEVKLAIEQNERALALRKEKLGDDHPDTLTSRSNLALAYLVADRTADAIRLYQQILKLREDKFGIEDPDTIKSRHFLADGFRKAGRIHEAIPLYERTLNEAEAKLGSNHPLTLQTMNNLSVAYKDAGQLKDAISLLETILERSRKRSSGVPANIFWHFNNLAKAYERAGELAKAEAVHRDALEEARRQFGAEDPDTAGVMAGLGSYLLRQHKFADAEPLLRDCLKIRETKQPDDWATFNARSLLGAAVLGQKEYAEAEPLLLQGYEGMKARKAKIPPQSKSRLTEALERLVQLYEATDQQEKTAQWRKKLQETKAAQNKPKP